MIDPEQQRLLDAEERALEVLSHLPRDKDGMRTALSQSFPLFAASMLKIRTKDGGPLWPFVLNDIQESYLNELRDKYATYPGRDRFRGIHDLIVKPRQLGFSTLIAALFFMDGFLDPGRITVVLTHKKDLSEELLRTYKTFWENLPGPLQDAVKLVADTKYDLEMEFSHAPGEPPSRFVIATELGQPWRGGVIHNLHACLGPETLVIGKDGFVYPITSPPSTVRDGNGSLIAVDRVSETDHAGENALKITTFGNSPFPMVVTGDHRVLTREFKTGMPVWKRSDDLSLSDYIAFPITNLSECKSKTLAIPRRRSCPHTPMVVEADAKFGELLGWYLAEGWTFQNGDYPSGISLAIHQDEEEQVMAVVTPFVAAGYFSSCRVTRKTDSKTTVITAYGAPFSTFIVNLVGKVDGKRIPDSFFRYPKPFLVGLLRGLLEGDGCFTNVRRVNFTTTRPQLAVQMKRLAVNMRIGLPGIGIRPAGVRHGRNEQEQWTVDFNGPANVKLRRILGKPLPPRSGMFQAYLDSRPDSPRHNHGYGRHKWRRGDRYYWARVTKIEQVDAPEKMYDLCLAEDPHSYCTLSGVVHNSEAAWYRNWGSFKASFVQAVPANGNICYETTVNGFNDYHAAVTASLAGLTTDRVIYYSWHQHKEYRLRWDPTGPPLTADEKRLMADYGLDLEQIAWRRWKVGELGNLFPQEYPESLLGAFLSSGRPFFDMELVQLGHQAAEKLPPPSSPRANVLVWEAPVPGEIYVLAVDVAEGIDRGEARAEAPEVGGADFCAAYMIRVSQLRVVAAIHGRLRPVELGRMVDRLGREYEATVAVERNNHGHTVIASLEASRYPEVYRHTEYNQAGQKFQVPGFPTTVLTRPMMLDSLDEAIRGKSLLCPDPGFWLEAHSFQRNARGKPEAINGRHDDRVMSLAIGVYLCTLGRGGWGIEGVNGADAAGFRRGAAPEAARPGMPLPGAPAPTRTLNGQVVAEDMLASLFSHVRAQKADSCEECAEYVNGYCKLHRWQVVPADPACDSFIGATDEDEEDMVNDDETPFGEG